MNRPENIEMLWRRFSCTLKSFIFSRVKDEADTDDILQNVFLKIHENIHNLKDESKLKQWIYQITRNLIIDYFRNKNKDIKIEGLEEKLMSNSASDRYMDTAIEDMIKMMDELPPEYCEALCQTEIAGISQKEYALRTGLSYSGAKSRVQRARLMLREMLLECCHYQFDKYGTVFDIRSNCCSCCPAKY